MGSWQAVRFQQCLSVSSRWVQLRAGTSVLHSQQARSVSLCELTDTEGWCSLWGWTCVIEQVSQACVLKEPGFAVSMVYWNQCEFVVGWNYSIFSVRNMTLNQPCAPRSFLFFFSWWPNWCEAGQLRILEIQASVMETTQLHLSLQDIEENLTA